MQHELKTINPFFRKVAFGLKTFELRKNDRGFKQHDDLKLMEYIPNADGGEYTGNFIIATVSYMLEGYEGLKDGYCILGITVIDVKIDE